jgi:hypothetical protein
MENPRCTAQEPGSIPAIQRQAMDPLLGISQPDACRMIARTHNCNYAHTQGSYKRDCTHAGNRGSRSWHPTRCRLRNAYRVCTCGSTSSAMDWSLEKRFKMRPEGLVWKNDRGALSTLLTCAYESCCERSLHHPEAAMTPVAAALPSQGCAHRNPWHDVMHFRQYTIAFCSSSSCDAYHERIHVGGRLQSVVVKQQGASKRGEDDNAHEY